MRAGALAASGDNDGAVAELRALVTARSSWATIIRSFAAKGLLTLPPRRGKNCWASSARRNPGP